MLPWNNRPPAVANLMNPAFCAVLLREAIEKYHEKNDKLGMPYPIGFIILPLVLHQDTRKVLPNQNPKLTLHEWVEANPSVLLRFAERTRQLVPYTREALIFGIQQGTIRITNDVNQVGHLIPTSKKYQQKYPWSKDSQAAIYKKQAGMLGRWLAQIGNSSLIFTTLRIRP